MKTVADTIEASSMQGLDMAALDDLANRIAVTKEVPPKTPSCGTAAEGELRHTKNL